MKYTYILLLLLSANFYSFAQQENRYIAPIFKDYNVYKNLTYAQVLQENVNGQLQLKDLK